MQIDVTERAKRAKRLFKEGYNCAQSVFMAFADLYSLDAAMAATISGSFGGGIGRMREVCGACSGMFLTASMAIPTHDVKDKAAKAANYKMVQELAAEFKAENGSIICRELLGLTDNVPTSITGERLQAATKKRPCDELVYMAAEILGNQLIKLEKCEF
ncbi:MAG: C-GCAxxG-C-C family protein [bacterium]